MASLSFAGAAHLIASTNKESARDELVWFCGLSPGIG
jgi:hypothetical protein